MDTLWFQGYIIAVVKRQVMKGLVNQKWSPIPANHGTLPSLSVETSISCYCNCHTAMSHFQPFHSALSDTFTILKQAHRITANELKQLNWSFTNQLNGQSHICFLHAPPPCVTVKCGGKDDWADVTATCIAALRMSPMRAIWQTKPSSSS